MVTWGFTFAAPAGAVFGPSNSGLPQAQAEVPPPSTGSATPSATVATAVASVRRVRTFFVKAEITGVRMMGPPRTVFTVEWVKASGT
ncbi:hypothetical protein GCM10009738_05080 [Kitasatospora viridis]